MEIIAHRRNLIDQLDETPTHYGVEVDLRSQGDDLVIHHDPYQAGVKYNDWIARYRHGTLILNTKEEGLEDRLLASMAEHKIEKFFFLDQSFPFLVRTVRRGEKRCAVRVSEYESVETALTLAGLADWIWIDHFTRWPLTLADWNRLVDAGFKLCIGSPELHGHPIETAIPAVRAILNEWGVSPDVVCTKAPHLWS